MMRLWRMLRRLFNRKRYFEVKRMPVGLERRERPERPAIERGYGEAAARYIEKARGA